MHGSPGESQFAYFHEEALEGKLLSLPIHGRNDQPIFMTIFEQGETYPLGKDTQPDGRKQFSYRHTTQIRRLQPDGTTVVPIWAITTNFTWGSAFTLNKVLKLHINVKY